MVTFASNQAYAFYPNSNPLRITNQIKIRKIVILTNIRALHRAKTLRFGARLCCFAFRFLIITIIHSKRPLIALGIRRLTTRIGLIIARPLRRRCEIRKRVPIHLKRPFRVPGVCDCGRSAPERTAEGLQIRDLPREEGVVREEVDFGVGDDDVGCEG